MLGQGGETADEDGDEWRMTEARQGPTGARGGGGRAQRDPLWQPTADGGEIWIDLFFYLLVRKGKKEGSA